MKIDDNVDSQRWASFVFDHPRGNIFQTPQMYEVLADARDTKPIFHCLMNEGELKGLYLGEVTHNCKDFTGVLTRRTVYSSEPLVKDDDDLPYLIQSAIRDGEGHFVEIRPRIGIKDEHLVKFGFRRREHLNSIIKLVSMDDNWQMLDKDKRKGINRAKQRYNVKITQDNSYEGVETCYAMLRRLYRNMKIPLKSKSFFHAIRKHLCSAGYADFFVASIDSRPIAFQLALIYKDEIYTYYTATEDEFKHKHAGDLLIWHLIEHGIRHGFAILNFGGGGDPRKEYGPREYKKRFGTMFNNTGRYRYFKNSIFPYVASVAALIGVKT